MKAIGRAEHASLFTTLAAAFALLLRRYSGADTLAIGMPMANRLREQDEGCVGFFANTLVTALIERDESRSFGRL